VYILMYYQQIYCTSVGEMKRLLLYQDARYNYENYRCPTGKIM